jgi:MFS family permease
MFYLDYVIFSTAFAMVGASTVVPDFVKRITDNPSIIGVAGVMYNFCWLMPQLFFSQIISRSTQRASIMTRVVIPFRILYILLAIFMLFVTNKNIILIAFLVVYGLFAMGDGFVTLIWADLLGSTLTNRARSLLFAVAQTTLAITVIGSREVVRYFLAPERAAQFPVNYIGLFAVVGVTFLIAAFCLAAIKEEEREEPLTPGPTFREFVPYLGEILRTDADFRHFSRTRILLDLATLAMPFYIVFGENILHLNSETIVGDSILLMTIGMGCGAILAAWLSQRFGSRAVIRMTGVAALCHPLFAVSSLVVGPVALYAVFFAIGMGNATTSPGYFNWVIQHAPPTRRPIYMGLTNTTSAASNLAPFLGGVVLSLLLIPLGETGAYSVLFLIAVTMAILGLLSALSLREARYVIEVLPTPQPAQSIS